MTSKILTVGQLKAIIADLEDDVPVVLAQGSDGGPSDIEVSNGATYQGQADDEDTIMDLQDQGFGYLNRRALILTSGFLSTACKTDDPVSR